MARAGTEARHDGGRVLGLRRRDRNSAYETGRRWRDDSLMNTAGGDRMCGDERLSFVGARSPLHAALPRSTIGGGRLGYLKRTIPGQPRHLRLPASRQALQPNTSAIDRQSTCSALDREGETDCASWTSIVAFTVRSNPSCSSGRHRRSASTLARARREGGSSAIADRPRGTILVATMGLARLDPLEEIYT